MTHLYFEGEARPERVKRLQRRRRRIATVTVLTAALVVALGARAWASDDCDGCYNGKQRGHTATIEQGTCGCARVGVHARSRHGGDTATATLAGKTRSTTLNSGGHGYIFFTGLPAGSYHATVQVGGKTYTTGRVRVKECQQTPTPTTIPPTTTTLPPPTVVTDPPGFHDTPDQPQGSSTDTKRSEPNPDDSIGAPTPPIEEAPVPATPGTLPFTGPKEDMQRAMLLSGLALVLAGVALVVTMRRKPAVAVEQGWGETRVRPDRDSADANLLATLFGRRSR